MVLLCNMHPVAHWLLKPHTTTLITGRSKQVVMLDVARGVAACEILPH